MADAKIVRVPASGVAGTSEIDDNLDPSVLIESADGKDYIEIDTTDSAERVILGGGGAHVHIGEPTFSRTLSVDGEFRVEADPSGATNDFFTVLNVSGAGSNGILGISQGDIAFRLKSSGANFGIANDSATHLAVFQDGKITTGGETTSLGSGAGSLHLKTGDSAATSSDVHADADDLIVEGSGNTGISILTPTNGKGCLYFIDENTGGTPDGIAFDQGTGSLRLQVANSERLRIQNDSVIRIFDGGKLSTGSESSPICASNGIHIKEDDTGIGSANTHADMLVIEANTHPGISLLSNNTSRNTIAFGDPQNSMAGELRYTHGGGTNADMFFLIMQNSVAINVDHDHKLGVNHECVDASGQLQVNCPDGANVPCVVVDQNDSTNNPVALEIQNAGTGDSILDDSGAKLTAAGVFTDASDIALKSDIETIPYGLETVLQLRPVGYDYKKTGQADIGFIAQEVEQIIPEVVFGENGSKSMSYGHLVAVLTKALQEMHTQIQELKNGD